MSDYWMKIEINTASVETFNSKTKEYLGGLFFDKNDHATPTATFEIDCGEQILVKFFKMLEDKECPNLVYKLETDFEKQKGVFFEGDHLKEEVDSNGNPFLPITDTVGKDNFVPITYEILADKYRFIELQGQFWAAIEN